MNTEKFEIVAKTFQGLEDVLAEEIRQLGGENVETGRRMVSFTGDKALLYKANLACRTALRILKPIYKFEASDPDEVYEKMKAFPWETLLSPETTFSIDSVTNSDSFRHSKFVTYRAKDAIADYFMEKNGKRPSVRLNGAEVVLNLHISHMSCTLSLDSSGESLHKRGYRVGQTEAPINEVLAAGMILKTGWHGEKDLIDPMCGSGTMPIEAAMLAENRAPGLNRGFAAEDWHFLPPTVFTEARMEARDMVEPKKLKIYASDIDPRCIDLCKKHAKKAGIMVEWAVKPVSELICREDSGIIVCNPPYGERLMDRRSIEKLYREMRTVFDRCKGHSKNIISSQRDFERIYGLRADKRRKLSNGGMQCTLYSYFRERKDD